MDDKGLPDVGDPGFTDDVATRQRRGVMLALPWPGPAAVACGGAERLLVAADEIAPDRLRAEAHALVEEAWQEVVSPVATPEKLTKRSQVADRLYTAAENRGGRAFDVLEVVLMVLGLACDALQERAAHRAVAALKEALEGVAYWADTQLHLTYGRGDRHPIDDIYRSEVFLREVAAWDDDIATVQRGGVSAESVAEIRQRARDVGRQYHQTIVRALTVDRDRMSPTRQRRGVILALSWPGPAAVACGAAERLLVAADEIAPDRLRAEAHVFVEEAWQEVESPAATPEELTERSQVADRLYTAAEDRGGRASDVLRVLLVVLESICDALRDRSAYLAWDALKGGLEGVAEWAHLELRLTHGRGDRYPIDEIYRSDACLRELAACDHDIATVQRGGVSADSVAEIRQRARDVGTQHQRTIVRALTVDLDR